MSSDDWGQLRDKATLTMQRRFRAILQRIADRGKADWEDAREVDAMGKIWSTLGLSWTRDDNEGIW